MTLRICSSPGVGGRALWLGDRERMDGRMDSGPGMRGG